MQMENAKTILLELICLGKINHHQTISTYSKNKSSFLLVFKAYSNTLAF